MRFPRQEDRSGLPFPTPGDLPDPGMEPLSSVLQLDSLLLSFQGSPRRNMYTLQKELQKYNKRHKIELHEETFNAPRENILLFLSSINSKEY